MTLRKAGAGRGVTAAGALAVSGSARQPVPWTAALVVAIVVAACAPAAVQPTRSPTASVWNVATWKPSTPITAPSVAADELASRRLALLQGVAKSLELSPMPKDPGLERWIRAEEIGAVHAKCLVDQGWTGVKPNAGGTGVQSDNVPDSQLHAFNTAKWVCWARYTPDQRFSEGRPAMYQFLYEYARDYLIPCLHAHGQQESMPLPTLQRYQANPGKYYFYPQGLSPSESDTPRTRARNNRPRRPSLAVDRATDHSCCPGGLRGGDDQLHVHQPDPGTYLAIDNCPAERERVDDGDFR